MTATSDKLYGRQGGRFVTADYQPGQLLDQMRKALVDPRPSTIVGTPAAEPADNTGWEDRARMAAARQHTGRPLDAIDREALRRHPTPRTAAEAGR